VSTCMEFDADHRDHHITKIVYVCVHFFEDINILKLICLCVSWSH